MCSYKRSKRYLMADDCWSAWHLYFMQVFRDWKWVIDGYSQRIYFILDFPLFSLFKWKETWHLKGLRVCVCFWCFFCSKMNFKIRIKIPHWNRWTATFRWDFLICSCWMFGIYYVNNTCNCTSKTTSNSIQVKTKCTTRKW